MGDLYALARAYGLMVVSASQLTSDYALTQEGERVLQNAHTALLLRHARGKGVQEAGDRYGLGAGDRRFLESCDRGEGVLVTPRGIARVRVTPSPWLLELMGGPLPRHRRAPVPDSPAPPPGRGSRSVCGGHAPGRVARGPLVWAHAWTTTTGLSPGAGARTSGR